MRNLISTAALGSLLVFASAAQGQTLDHTLPGTTPMPEAATTTDRSSTAPPDTRPGHNMPTDDRAAERRNNRDTKAQRKGAPNKRGEHRDEDADGTTGTTGTGAGAGTGTDAGTRSGTGTGAGGGTGSAR